MFPLYGQQRRCPQRDTIRSVGTFVVFFLGLMLVAVVLFLLASFAFGRGEEMAPAPPDSTPVELPDDRPVEGRDVRALRLSVAVRGYRMREVDWVLEQLALALEDRDRRIAELWATETAPGTDGILPGSDAILAGPDPILAGPDPIKTGSDAILAGHNGEPDDRAAGLRADDPRGPSQDPGKRSHDPGGPGQDPGKRSHDADGPGQDSGGPGHDPAAQDRVSGGRDRDFGGPGHNPAARDHDPGGPGHDTGGRYHDSGGRDHDAGGPGHDPAARDHGAHAYGRAGSADG